MKFGQTHNLLKLENRLQRTARILSERWHVRVVFQQDACHTDQDTIYLPSLPPDASGELVDVLEGHLDHELAHIKFTDFSVLSRIQNPAVKSVWNMLEDGRVEKQIVSVWPGSAVHLQASLEWILRNPISHCWPELSTFAKLVTALGVYAQTDFDLNHWFLWDVAGGEFVANLLALEDDVRRAIQAPDSQTVLELAEKFLVKSKIKDDRTEEVIASEEEWLSRTKWMLTIAKIHSPSRIVKYQVCSTEGDQLVYQKKGNHEEFRKLYDSVNVKALARSEKMVRHLQVKQGRWRRNLPRGRVDAGRVHKLALGISKQVFKRQELEERNTTTVEILIDHSESMRNHAEKATQAAIILGETLAKLDILFSITGHSTSDQRTSEARFQAASKAEQALYTRWGNLWRIVYKDYDESWYRTKVRLSEIKNNIQKYSYEGEAVKWAASRLEARESTRRILLVIEDGKPRPPLVQKVLAHYGYLQEVLGFVEKRISVCAFALNSNAVGRFYRNWVSIENEEELPQTCLSQLMKLLEEPKVGISA